MLNRVEPQSKQTRSVGYTNTPGLSIFLRPEKWIIISAENSTSLSEAQSMHGMTCSYPASCYAGGGYVWDAVLEYRVWCHPRHGGGDYYRAFASYAAALRFSRKSRGAEKPLALIMQKEHIAEPNPGQYSHVKKRRITEWPVAFLSRPRRTKYTIPDFLSPTAPKNRLAILRGLARKRG